MLTADLVRARRRGDELVLIGLDAEARDRARALAEMILEEMRAHLGKTREELDAVLATIEVEARDERLKAGLVKLADDRCSFEVTSEVDAAELRRALFLRAAAARKLLPFDTHFDRSAFLASFATERGLTADAVERGLFSDLRGAHILRQFTSIDAPSLVDAWERGQAQAVLLRAVRVTVDVACASPGATRALFHRLKFLRLLHTIEKREEGHRLVIDGPFNLFESASKYGLQLALLLPLLDACDRWSLVADVRWGAERSPLVFRLEGEAPKTTAELPVSDDVAALVTTFERLRTGFRVSRADAILELPGVGLCVPDLAFERDGGVVYLEVMGYWSRDAVWRRVELVQSGMTEPILFAVSSRLRVSAEVLDSEASGALYVYKGTMNASAIATRVEDLASRQSGRQSGRAGGGRVQV